MNRLYYYVSTIALINIHYLNPKNQALNQRHRPRTKQVSLKYLSRQMWKTRAPQENKRHAIHVSSKEMARNTCKHKTCTQTNHLNPYATTKVGETKSSQKEKFETVCKNLIRFRVSVRFRVRINQTWLNQRQE